MTPTRRHRILIVDDHPPIRLAIAASLRPQGYAIEEAGSVREARDLFAQHRFDAVILDYRLPDGDALALMADLLAEDPALPVVLLTGHASIELAVEAMRQGAESFLTKPTDLEALAMVLRRALKAQRMEKRALAADRTAKSDARPNPFTGTSAAIRRLEREARLALRTDSPILIEGETGTGKGVLASWIHHNGPRSEAPFVDLNCAGLTSEFLDSELFGHVQGAFTGASQEKKGLLEIADRGTLFLDEVGDTEPVIQAKLLKAIEEQRFRKLGSVRDQRVDVHLLTATNRNLQRMCEEGSFRSDLYYRISTLVLRLPPLRERPGDIPELARSILAAMKPSNTGGTQTLHDNAIEVLQAYPWPGNIRELRNVLERARLATNAEVIERRHLRLDPARVTSRPASGRLEQLELHEIERALANHGGVIKDAAQSLGVSRSTIYNKIKALDIDVEKFRSGS